MILLDVHMFSLTIGNPVPMSGNLSFSVLCRKRLGRSAMVQHHEGCSSRTRGGEQGIVGGMQTSSGARSASSASSLEEMQNQNEGTLWGQVPINPGRMPCSWIVLCDLHTIAHLNRFLRGYTGIPIKTMKLLESIIACNYLLCVGQLVTS